jgi:uncharacterized protein (TIRG00374 family)
VVSKIRIFIKILIPCLCIVVLWKLIDPHIFINLFSNLNWSSIFWLLSISFIMVLISAFKWKILIDYLGSKTPLVKLFGLYLIGYFTNLLLPSYLGGDAVRSYYIGKEVGQSQAAAATIFERFSGILSMSILALISSFFLREISTLMQIWIVIFCIALVLVFLISVSNTTNNILNKLIEKKIRFINPIFKLILKLSDSFKIVSKNKKLLAEVFFLSFLFHGMTVVNTVACAYAIGWSNISWIGVGTVIPTILIISALPIAPQGLGLQEGAFVFFLHTIGGTTEQALGISLLLRAKGYVLALVGGLLYLFPTTLTSSGNLSAK